MKPYNITDLPLNPEEYRAWVRHPRAGAIVVFTGHVREWTGDIRTCRLIYEAYVPMAERMLALIGDETVAKWPGTKIAIGHRIGILDITDIAVVVAVSSPHRKAAYEANEYAIERLKTIVPIWKQEVGEHHQTNWIHGGSTS